MRIEDVDTPRCVEGAAEHILAQLAGCGLVADAPPVWQSTRGAAYAQAVETLRAAGLAYPCACTRIEIDAALAAAGRPHRSGEERVYPGTCRNGLSGRPARAIRCLTSTQSGSVHWHDRRLGAQAQHIVDEVGDFVLLRADGLWAYQLAVVVDDGWQGITHIVRGEDLADNTPRQIHLQRCLGLPTPVYLHTPLVSLPDGRKLSKQHGAAAVAAGLATLQEALNVLEMPTLAPTIGEQLNQAVAAWRARWCQSPE